MKETMDVLREDHVIHVRSSDMPQLLWALVMAQDHVLANEDLTQAAQFNEMIRQVSIALMRG